MSHNNNDKTNVTTGLPKMSIINIQRNRDNIMNRWSFVIVLIKWYFVVDKPWWLTIQSDYDNKLWKSHLHFNNALKCNIVRNTWICNLLVKKCGLLCFNVIKCGLHFWNIPYLKKTLSSVVWIALVRMISLLQKF